MSELNCSDEMRWNVFGVLSLFLMVKVCIFESLFFIVSGPKGSYLAAAAAAAVATSWQQTLTKSYRPMRRDRPV